MKAFSGVCLFLGICFRHGVNRKEHSVVRMYVLGMRIWALSERGPSPIYPFLVIAVAMF
jgi:hypothetical protein